MTTNSGTRLIQRPDGGETLVLQRARLVVLEGPDTGHTAELDHLRTLVGADAECDLRLTDPTVSKRHAELRAVEGGLLLRDLGSTNGTRLGGAGVREVLLDAAATFKVGATVIRLDTSEDALELPLSGRGRFGDLLGASVPMRRLFAELELAATSVATVLLEGESGTGKEVAADAIVQHSDRGEGPFEVVDCGAIPPSLLEEELFGHEAGAFTGATGPRAGALERANEGTLFLDEVGELPLELQPKLLRFLDRRQVKRLGANHYQALDVRVIAATNRPLLAAVREGRFRQDLYYRLAVIRVELPPLRHRPEDVPLLAAHFAREQCEDPRSIITKEVEGLLTAYPWPGNVRQLRNIVQQLTVVPGRALDTLRQQPRVTDAPQVEALIGLPFHEARRRWQESFERRYLSEQLRRSDGVVTHAAEQAGLPRQSFHRLIRRHRLREG